MNKLFRSFPTRINRSFVAGVFLSLSFLCLAVIPSAAQLGSGIVFDPKNFNDAIQRHLEQIKQTSQLIQQLQQLQQLYQLSQQQFALLTSEAKSIPTLPNRYRTTFSNWQQYTSGNQYGNTGLWTSSINSGQPSAIQASYRQLVGVVQPVDVTITPQAQQDWRQQYGLLQLQDASIMNAMKAVGDVRTNLQNNAQTLAQLEADSSDPSLQSSKALQQKTLVALLLLIRNVQDTNRMLEATVNLHIQQQAQDRWERGRTLNGYATDLAPASH